MKSQLSLVLRNETEELERMSEEVSAWCKANEISAATEFRVNLTLDEIVSNVIRHGWKDGGEHQLDVRIFLLEDELRLEVEDDATPFNPLEAPPPDISSPLEERPIGGLGVHLVRQIMDELAYRRLDGKNLLVMKMKIGGT